MRADQPKDVVENSAPSGDELRTGRHLTRRRFLQVGGATAVLLVPGAQALATPANPGRLPEGLFGLGVASGDPLPDAVVIWTRLAPEPLALDGNGGMPSRKVPVHWEVARDEGFRQVVRRGMFLTAPDLGHSVHVDVTGLASDSWYYYRFRVQRDISPTGRTRTAPAEGQTPGTTTFAIASCQRFTDGYYTAYQAMLADDPDLVLHLGDYFYEKDNGPGDFGRQHLPIGECRTLADYRVRIAQIRTDPDMQAIHAAAPFAVTFDDHEVSGNWAGDIPETGEAADDTLEEFRALKAAAFRSYYEHMPLRATQRPDGYRIQMYRRLHWGTLATINLLDTRQYRSDQIYDDAAAWDPNRTMLGATQQQWLLDELSTTTATWNVLAQQVPFLEDSVASINRNDKWDGYRVARQGILDTLATGTARNPIVLSGDIHAHRGGNLKADFQDPGSATVGAEYTGTSITSSSGVVGDQPITAAHNYDPDNPHLLFKGTGRGYARFSVTPDTWTGDFRFVDTIEAPTSPAGTLATYTAYDGEPGITRTSP